MSKLSCLSKSVVRYGKAVTMPDNAPESLIEFKILEVKFHLYASVMNSSTSINGVSYPENNSISLSQSTSHATS